VLCAIFKHIFIFLASDFNKEKCMHMKLGVLSMSEPQKTYFFLFNCRFSFFN